MTSSEGKSDLVERLKQIEEMNAEMLTEFWISRHGTPDSRGKWKDRAIAAEATISRLERELAEAREARAILEGHLTAAIDDYNDARRQAFEEAAQIAVVFAGKHEPSYGLVNKEIHQAVLAVVTALRAKAKETEGRS